MKKLFYIAFFLLTLLGAKAATALERSGSYAADDAYMLATIIYHEIGGYSEADMQQVANVVMNQYDKYRSGKGGENVQIGDILTKKWNFSFSEKYLNRNMTNEQIYAKIPKDAASQKAWESAMKIAQMAVKGQLADITQGATHYRTCNRKTGSHTTFWGATALNLEHNGPHCFFKDIKMGALKVNGKVIAYEGKVTGKYNSGSYVGDGSKRLGGGGWGNLGDITGGSSVSYDNGSFSDLMLNDDEYQALCASARNNGFAQTDTPTNLWDTDILEKMEAMMAKIYRTLGRVYALGHGLMCYAINVGYHCLGLEVAGYEYCVTTLVNLSFWICGAVIYVVAFFMTMAVGMYFLDVSFKIGFALLMLPLSIALWPFAPTKGKLGENFSIIIRNAMLFTVVAIGVSYAVMLIENGLLQGIDMIKFKEALHDRRSSYLTEDYSLDSMHILVIAFCLIFALKIIASSVNDYLNKIFPDNVFGGSSPMHHMGTQALGYVQSRTITPAVSLVKDMAKNGAGIAMQATGRGLVNMAHGDFSGVKGAAVKTAAIAGVIGHKFRNPSELRKDVVDGSAALMKKAVSGAGEVVKEAADIKRLFKRQYSEDERQANKRAFNAKTDAVVGALHGLIDQDAEKSNKNFEAVEGTIKDIGKGLKNEFKTGKLTKDAIVAGATQIHNLTHGDDNQMSQEQMRENLHNIKEIAKTGAQIAGMKAQNLGDKIANSTAGQAVQGVGRSLKDAGQDIKGFGDDMAGLYDGVKDGVADAVAGTVNMVTGKDIDGIDMREKLHNAKENAKKTLKGLGKAAAVGVEDGVVNYDQGSYSLSPGTILQNAANVAVAPLQAETYKQLLKLPEICAKREQQKAEKQAAQAEHDAQILPNATAAQRLIMKSTRGVTRLFVRTGVNTASETANVAGILLQDFGKKLRQNKPQKGGWAAYLKAKQDAEREEAIKRREEAETNENLTERLEERSRNKG